MLLERHLSIKDYMFIKEKFKVAEFNGYCNHSNHIALAKCTKESKTTNARDKNMNLDMPDPTLSSKLLWTVPRSPYPSNKTLAVKFQFKTTKSGDMFTQLSPIVKKSEIFIQPKSTNNVSSKYIFNPVTIGKNRSVQKNVYNKKHSLQDDIQRTNTKKNFIGESKYFSNSRKSCHTSCGFHRHHQNVHHHSKSVPVTSLSKRAFETPPKNSCKASSIRPTTEYFVYAQNVKKKKSAKELSATLPPTVVNSLHHAAFYLRSKTTVLPKKTSQQFWKTDSNQRSGESTALSDLFQKGDCLRDRLSLIHCYGNEYEKIAEKKLKEHEKQIALKRQRLKEAENLEKEKIKQDQRKKIYALNRLMTKMEQEHFQEFMNSHIPTEMIP